MVRFFADSYFASACNFLYSEMAIRFTSDFYRDNKNLINSMVSKHGRPVLVEMWKERFFYFVLKWEFNYIDESGKASALSTDQIDVENGERYKIEFIDEQNNKRNPIILHNSPSGAIERVIYALLENAASNSKHGKKPSLPLWLSPTQARIIPVNPEFDSNAQDLAKKLTSDLVRADIDDRDESMGRRVRESEKEWVPYTLVIEFDAAFSSSAYMTRSMAPLGELCSMIGLRLLFCSSINSILYRSHHFLHQFGQWIELMPCLIHLYS